MKALLTSDPHLPLPLWHKQLLPDLAARRGCALVAISGDHLNIEGRRAVTLPDQRAIMAGRLRALAARVPALAVCSGNHDVDRPGGATWLEEAAADVFNLAVDGWQFVVEGGLLVTCCPFWRASDGRAFNRQRRERCAALWHAGRQLADRLGLPWLVLYHEPPAVPRTDGITSALIETAVHGDPECTAWVGRYQPDFLLCGHAHQAPFAQPGAWATPMRAVGEETFDGRAVPVTWCLNAGRRNGRLGEGPGFIELDVNARTARWLDPQGVEVDRRGLPARLEAEPETASNENSHVLTDCVSA